MNLPSTAAVRVLAVSISDRKGIKKSQPRSGAGPPAAGHARHGRIELNTNLPLPLPMYIDRPPVVCIVGFSNSGKTTVTVGLVAALSDRGFRVGTIKHDVHGFEMDRPGKDSWRHRQAGASATIVTSPDRIGMVMEADHDHQPDELLPLFKRMDIVIAEGFKRSRLPKIEVFRPENGKPPACLNDPSLTAVVSSADLDWGVPRFLPGDTDDLVQFVIQRFINHGCTTDMSCTVPAPG